MLKKSIGVFEKNYVKLILLILYYRDIFAIWAALYNTE